jgi:6-phospho-beta-glucosidase
MRLVVVGAGSQSTPHLFLTPQLASMAASMHVTLTGRTDEKTAAVARAIQTLNPAYVLETANIEDDLGPQFASADVILIQARYGGYEARLHDETFPLEFGVPGDEGLGPGGLANAWRSWPALHDLLQRLSAANSQAAIVCMTAPLGILTRCARQAFPRLRWYAICELPYVTLTQICAPFGLNPGGIDYDYAGVNHLGWFDRVEVRGTDLVERFAERREPGHFPGAALVRRLQAIPLKYLELHYYRRTSAARQACAPSRALRLAKTARQAAGVYRSGDAYAILAMLRERPAPWYRDAIAPLLGFLTGHPLRVPLFLTCENAGYLPDLNDDDVIEMPYVAGGGGLHRRERKDPLAPRLAQTLRRFVEFERIAARAVYRRDLEAMLEALAVHPWIDAGDAEKLATRSAMLCSSV